jgi:dihydroneopterin aldolase
MDIIRINALQVECIVGVRPHERRRKQLVRLNLELALDLSHAGRSGRIAHTCDYSQTIEHVSALLKFREYKLIEVATEELAAMLFGAHPVLTDVVISLEKPAALEGRARSAAVRIERSRRDFTPSSTSAAYGEQLLLLETHEAALYMLRIDPGKALELSTRGPERRLGWLVAGELECDRRQLGEGDPIAFDRNREIPMNRSGKPALVFVCVTR